MTQINVLNHGYVRLIDSMGDDQRIVDTARTSYAKGTKKVSEDRGLIRYLVRHLHTSPLESVIFSFEMKMPIFVARQLVRHRTQSINEMSLRYSEATDEFYIPESEHIAPQSTTNKQGREGSFSEEELTTIESIIVGNSLGAFENYEELLSMGLARELARSVLPVNIYTKWYTTMNLHNLFHFLKLRMDKHTQYETRVYANAIFKLIQPIVPTACEAFTDYIFDGETYQNYVISRMERDALIRIIRDYEHTDGPYPRATSEEQLKKTGMSQREIDEFIRKFKLDE